MNYLLETSLTEIIKQIKLEYPYDDLCVEINIMNQYKIIYMKK